MSFLFTKTENRKARQFLSGGLVPVLGWGRWIRWKYYVDRYINGKMRPVETTPGMGIGNNDRVGEFN
jgi:hypothetical protein